MIILEKRIKVDMKNLCQKQQKNTTRQLKWMIVIPIGSMIPLQKTQEPFSWKNQVLWLVRSLLRKRTITIFLNKEQWMCIVQITVSSVTKRTSKKLGSKVQYRPKRMFSISSIKSILHHQSIILNEYMVIIIPFT